MGNYRLRVSTGQVAAVAGLLRGPAGEYPRQILIHITLASSIGLSRADIIAIVGGHCH